MKYFLIYLILINILSIILCVIDKHRASKKKWRISEKTLFVTSIIGGSIGMYMTMLAVRHKTRHKRFTVGLPLIIAAQTVLAFWLLIKYC